jgi:hypothetical protein
MDHLQAEINRLDQDICSILSKNPRSSGDDEVLVFKKQRLADQLKALAEERDFQRELTRLKLQSELTGALSIFRLLGMSVP